MDWIIKSDFSNRIYGSKSIYLFENLKFGTGSSNLMIGFFLYVAYSDKDSGEILIPSDVPFVANVEDPSIGRYVVSRVGRVFVLDFPTLILFHLLCLSLR